MCVCVCVCVCVCGVCVCGVCVCVCVAVQSKVRLCVYHIRSSLFCILQVSCVEPTPNML